MRVLVTGVAGFIGSHLADRLLAQGDEVVGVDDLSTGRLENLEGALTAGLSFTEADITTPQLPELVAQARPEVVYHLAAQMDVRRSVLDPLHDTRVNVLGTVNVLTAAVAADVRKVVFASSGGTVYGEPASLPVEEDAPLAPTSPYGAAKVAGEVYLAAFSRLHGLAFTALALGNVYGPRQDPHGEAGVVAIFGRALLRGEPTTIYGDGTSRRDYVHVDDVVDAFVRAAGDAADGQRLNVGTGEATTVRALHTLLARAAGVADEPRFAPGRLGELDAIALAPAAAGRVLGWRPSVALDEGLQGTVDWVRTGLTSA